MKVGVIGPRPDTLAPIQDDIKHMENIGKRKEVGEWKRISWEFSENPSSVMTSEREPQVRSLRLESYTHEKIGGCFVVILCTLGRGGGWGGSEELHFNEAMKAWLTSR